ncbi:hypothetical protein [Nesterenkonia suensis]
MDFEILPRKRRTAAAVLLAAPLLLAGCVADDPNSEETADTAPSPQESEPEDADDATGGSDDEAEEAADPEEQEEESGADDAEEEIVRDGLPDPDTELEAERTEELGAFFSEEEACMTVGSTVDGLRADMEEGLESPEDADGAYAAVEQTYLLVPEDLRGPLETIAGYLEADHGAIDAPAVLAELEPLEDWMLETCDGQYHQQDLPEDQGDADSDPETDQETEG